MSCWGKQLRLKIHPSCAHTWWGSRQRVNRYLWGDHSPVDHVMGMKVSQSQQGTMGNGSNFNLLQRLLVNWWKKRERNARVLLMSYWNVLHKQRITHLCCYTRGIPQHKQLCEVVIRCFVNWHDTFSAPDLPHRRGRRTWLQNRFE